MNNVTELVEHFFNAAPTYVFLLIIWFLLHTIVSIFFPQWLLCLQTPTLSSDATTVRMVWELRLVYDSIVKPMCNLDVISWSFNAAEEALNT